MSTFRTVAMWTGVAVIASCGVILLGGGKVVSGALMIATAFTLALTVKRRGFSWWARVGLVCVVLALVAANISTTEIPDPSMAMAAGCTETAFTATPTGFKFLDQVILIFNHFLAQAAPS
ncbi:hypothetical protein [Glycomyces dulcitolivorans]|uniref:hypothetical protein n=1 Tax=Glycomyces dulcitolivorans TaxID=2200759 RepID=UPI000DD36BDD|nr:hypothetical protein [Glycomyces dulcitolivorans]